MIFLLTFIHQSPSVGFILHSHNNPPQFEKMVPGALLVCTSMFLYSIIRGSRMERHIYARSTTLSTLEVIADPSAKTLKHPWQAHPKIAPLVAVCPPSFAAEVSRGSTPLITSPPLPTFSSQRASSAVFKKLLKRLGRIGGYLSWPRPHLRIPGGNDPFLPVRTVPLGQLEAEMSDMQVRCLSHAPWPSRFLS